MKKIILFILIASVSIEAQNYLSNLNATKKDPIYTAYASSLERTNYKLDQGYSLSWFDPEKGIGFESKDGGNIYYAFKSGRTVRYLLKELYKEPVITTSYSDLVKFYFYPFKDIRVDAAFVVYSSQFTLHMLAITNESSSVVDLAVYPHFELNRINKLEYDLSSNTFNFFHSKARDNWMKEHSIPYTENIKSIFAVSEKPASYGAYEFLQNKSADTLQVLQKSFSFLSLNNSINKNIVSSVAFQNSFVLKPNEKKEIRIVRGLEKADYTGNRLSVISDQLMEMDPELLVKENEKIYSRIPRPEFEDTEKEMLYWNAFSLIRQCMMKPEGECNYNYYVFSREPKWGWGYGGQVFHESIVMLAYVFMDPESAMNSQRVYMERQHLNGYINYRTGPYLNEQIIHNGEYTSSAPWFNYINYEIYKVTGNKKFLKEAYESGKKFYNWFVARRDSNNNGLASWGGHAELESVRDARVAVWDKVGWASGFEGPDVNSMLVMEEKSLAAMASILGFKEESNQWYNKSLLRSALINRFLWDDSTNFYYNVNKNDQSFTFKNNNDLKIKEIIGFLPMWAGAADQKRADKLLRTLLNKDEFWRKFGVPSLSAKDDYYNPIGYWNGPIWVPWQYLLFRGLIDYGYKNEAKQLADKVMLNIINQLKTDHYFWEFYSADDFQAGWNKTYIWTGIIARFLIDLDSL
ncbi:MAG: trehalase family glycosidase [Bacteroidota bacterium]